MTEGTKKVILNTAKELGRIAVLGAVSALIAYITALPQTEFTIIFLFILRGCDQILHEAGKISGSESLKKGLVRF